MRARIVVAVLVSLALVPSAWGAVGEDISGRADIEVAGPAVAPTAAQRTAVSKLGARVEWNRYGTPSTLIKSGGFVATGVTGASAVEAARSWLDANRQLFRLATLDGLELAGDAQLAQSDGHAVSFRQTFDGLEAAGGGLVTVGLAPGADGAWRIASVSSTLTGDETIAGAPQIQPEQAYQEASISIGDRPSLAQIQTAPAAKGQLPGWEQLDVAGNPTPQRVRAVAFPTLTEGVVPAYETLVLDPEGPLPEAFQVFVDARNGAILARHDLVENNHEGPPPVFQFQGTLPPVDGGCDTRKGPYPVEADDHVRAVEVFAASDGPQLDIVIKLYRGTTQVAEADSAVTPERMRYSPSGGVPPGDYFVEMCEFVDNAAPRDPRGYTGTVTLDNTPTPPAYIARWSAFGSSPPQPALSADPWNHPSSDTRARWCWRQTTPAECTRAVSNLASRAPWDHDTKTGLSTSTTVGNNAVTGESWQATAPSPTQFRPVNPLRDYTFPWTNAWAQSDCNSGTPYGAAYVRGQSFDISAAVTNLFVMHNRMHDWSYNLGFTEQNWNAQADNFGLTEGFQANDPVMGDAQAGALVPPSQGLVRNNANMSTLPDGLSSFSNMYLWQPIAATFYAPCVDGDYDMSIIGHEYGHMIENRMIGKGSNRAGHHAGAMGESAGDLMALEYLQENGFVPTGDENPFAAAPYATGNKLRGIRNYAGNFPATGAFPTPSVYSQIDPLNLSDIGYDLTGPQVHADGEIWTATNFDIRKALIAKYGEGDRTTQVRCAEGILPADVCPGNRRWIQLLLDAFLLMPTNPSMLDARNAVLSADMLRFNGANQADLWLAFARRGMGRNATSTNGTGRASGVESDTNPAPDFESPNHPAVAVSFDAAEAGGGPAVPARIFVGHYEARVSPIADTDPATTGTTLDATANFAPGTYEFVARAPGYGHVRFRRTFEAGAAQAVSIRMPPNWASSAQGARATGNVSPVLSTTGAEIISGEQVLSRLIDDTEATNWQVAATRSGDAFAVAGKQVTINLAGGAHPIERVQVSAALGPVYDPEARVDMLPSRFTALRAFEVWACDSTRDGCGANSTAYRQIYTSPDDAFPADAPRPVQPVLILREFDVPRTRATHLRIVVRSSQCTGAPAYQGEQDADPFNATDCDTAGGASSRFVRIAEVQAFTGTANVR